MIPLKALLDAIRVRNILQPLALDSGDADSAKHKLRFSEQLVIPPCKVLHDFEGYFMRFGHIKQKCIDIRMPGGNRRISLCHGHDFADARVLFSGTV